MKDLIRIDPSDNVAVAIRALSAGETVSDGVETVHVREEVPAGHKICMTAIPKGASVVKYGRPIGTAAEAIEPGAHVHTQNVKTGLGGVLDYVYRPKLVRLAPRKPESFLGFRRSDGKAGIRNEIWIIPTVGCVNSVAKEIEMRSRAFVHGSVGGVFAFSHPYGCSQLGGDLDRTRAALCGLIRHPNAGGVLVLGLGCENNGIESMKKELGSYDENRVRFLNCQDSTDEIADGVAKIRELCDFAARSEREPLPASELIVGLKCGGSDGFSGITANPLVGRFADRLISEGGTAILSEVPEMFGAETALMERCETREVFDKTKDLINGFKEYFLKNGEAVSDNPSPGNKAGGITTLEDKSLGCIQKGGHSPVEDVLLYGQPVEKKGLNLLQAPGNDLVSATAEAVSGAQLILFTTGRGTPFGSPVPTVKISTNTALFQKHGRWIDFNAGDLLENASPEEKDDALFAYVLSLASGEKETNSERGGYRDFAIFKNGVTL